MKSISNCIVCKNPLSGKQRTFCSLECKNEHFLSYDVIKTKALERKSKFIDSLGGACLRCGYMGSLDALSFYDENGETLHINTNVLANSNYEKLEKKLASAQVLCRNCVEAGHNPQMSSRARPRDLLGVDFSTSVEMTNAKFIQNLVHCGVKPGQTIVLGVSGGVDSITMLDLFAKSKLKLNTIVAHMNHGLRKESELDESLVQALAKKNKYKYTQKRLQNYSDILANTRIVNAEKNQNLEEYLRNKRREFLLSTASKYKADFVALAHNANDQAETFIMNAVRGSGPAGLGAMNMSGDKLIRPLLNFSRQEIESYAIHNKLLWHEDITNKDTSYSRNYVRHRILPLLERLNPEYLSAIHRTTHLQRQIDEHLKEEAYRIIANHPMSVTTLRRLDKPLLYEVLGLLYEGAKGDRQNLSLTHLNAVEKLLKSSAGTRTLDLPGSIVAKRSYDMLYFCTKKVYNMPSAVSTKKLRIGKQKFGDWEILVETHPHLSSRLSKTSGEIPQKILGDSSSKVGMTNSNDEIIIDAKLLPNLVLRNRKPGDKIASIGLSGTKKLQDLFVDAKIDKVKRTSWPVLEDTALQKVIWVPGLAKAKIISNSKNLLKIKIVEAKK